MHVSDVIAHDWASMDARPKLSMTELSAADIPASPGVYALYCEGARAYIGKGASLRDRIWGNHSRRGVSMTNSALRRNIAELLGVATSAEIKARRYMPRPADVSAVRGWLDQCKIAWIECETEASALSLENKLKGEHMPFLTKR